MVDAIYASVLEWEKEDEREIAAAKNVDNTVVSFDVSK